MWQGGAAAKRNTPADGGKQERLIKLASRQPRPISSCQSAKSFEAVSWFLSDQWFYFLLQVESRPGETKVPATIHQPHCRDDEDAIL
jgi:hypothetical protein